jgi:hypothetical protein
MTISDGQIGLKMQCELPFKSQSLFAKHRQASSSEATVYKGVSPVQWEIKLKMNIVEGGKKSREENSLKQKIVDNNAGC